MRRRLSLSHARLLRWKPKVVEENGAQFGEEAPMHYLSRFPGWLLNLTSFMSLQLQQGYKRTRNNPTPNKSELGLVQCVCVANFCLWSEQHHGNPPQTGKSSLISLLFYNKLGLAAGFLVFKNLCLLLHEICSLCLVFQGLKFVCMY